MLARRAGAVLLAIMLGAGLAACGDDGGSEDDAVDQVDRDNGDDGNTDDGNTDDGSSDDGDGSAIGGAFEERCAELSGFFATVSAAISGTVDEEVLEAQEAFEDAVEDAPEEIRDDFETYVGAYTEYAEALADAGIDFEDVDAADFSDPEVLAALQEASQIFSDPELVAAATEISEFFASGCQG